MKKYFWLILLIVFIISAIFGVYLFLTKQNRWLVLIIDYFEKSFGAAVNVVATVALNQFNQPPVPGPTTSGGGGGGGGGQIIQPTMPTRVVLKGKAYPASTLTVLKDGQKVVTTQSDDRANFEVEIPILTSSIYTFGIWGEDKQKRRSLTFSFTTNVPFGVTTAISGILLPPTIDLSKNNLQRGEVLNLLGYSAPQNEIAIYVNSPNEFIEKTKAAADGTWFFGFDTKVLGDGLHSAKAKSTSVDGTSSIFSQSMSFGIGKEVLPAGFDKSDINGDNKVNLVDLSILLYNWGKPKNAAIDLNGDGLVNLKDFSILLYWWTG